MFSRRSHCYGLPRPDVARPAKHPKEKMALSKSEQFLAWRGRRIREVRMMENFKSSREAGAWQPSQNLAFLIIACGMVLSGVLVFLL